MTKKSEPHGGPDPDMGRIYRSIASEAAPGHLHRGILEQAKAEVGNDAWFTWFIPWLRPAAFAATFGLSLALLLEFAREPGLIPVGPETTVPSAPKAPPVDDFASAAKDSSSRIRAIGRTAAEQAQSGDPVGTGYQTSGALDTEERFCDSEQSATPESWLACIEDLRARGRPAEADAELERLRLAHPDVAPDLD